MHDRIIKIIGGKMIKVNKFESYAIVASQGEPGQFPEEHKAFAY
jgi:hypothetical protein